MFITTVMYNHANKCSLFPNLQGVWPVSFVCPSRGWACCAWTTTTSNISTSKVHPLVAYEIIQHDDVVFINSATNCLSLSIYYEHLSWANSPLFNVLKTICGWGCPRAGGFHTVSSGTAQPLSSFLWVVDSHHITHPQWSWSPGTIKLEYFTGTVSSPFSTTESEPGTGVSTFTWAYMTGEPVCPVVWLKGHIVPLVYCCVEIYSPKTLKQYHIAKYTVAYSMPQVTLFTKQSFAFMLWLGMKCN